MSEGGVLDIFDGIGGLYRCELIKAHQRRAQIQVLDCVETAPKPPQAPSLAIALLKGQAMDRAIQQATELGAQQIWLLQSGRSNVTLNPERLLQKLEHWRRVVASASEQCGQLWLPSLHSPTSITECLAAQSSAALPLIFDPQGDLMPTVLNDPEPIVFIGPEGGWSDEELQLFAREKIAIYRLGNTVLRAETMPAVALALVQQARGWAT